MVFTSRIILLAACSLIIALPFASFADETMSTAALYELIAVNIPEEDVEGFEDVILSALKKNPRLDIAAPVTDVLVYSRDRLGGAEYAALDELVGYGTENGIDYIVDGKIQRFDQTWMLELRIVNVVEGKLEKLENKTVEGDAKEARKTLEKLAETVAAQLVNQNGILYVTTNPPASAVNIDGVSWGMAPVHAELPGGVKYTVSASRAGHHPRQESVKVGQGDSVHVKLRLKGVSNTEKSPIYMRTWVSGGWPIGQSSSSFDNEVRMKDGQSWGAAASFGNQWRIRFGLYTFTGIVRDIDPADLQSYGAAGDPLSKSLTFHSTLIYSGSRDHFGPYIGLGLGAVQREVTIKSLSGSEKTRETNFFAAWLIQLGIEFGFSRHFGGQFELLHTYVMGSRPDVSESETDYVHPIWDRSFERFRAFTVLRFSLGYRL